MLIDLTNSIAEWFGFYYDGVQWINPFDYADSFLFVSIINVLSVVCFVFILYFVLRVFKMVLSFIVG